MSTTTRTCKRGARNRCWAGILAGLVLSCPGFPPRDADGSVPDFDLGFVATKDVDLDGNTRVRALGPLLEYQVAGTGGVFKAVRPFVSTVREPERDRTLTEVLWPAGMFKDFREDRSWRFLLAYGNDFDNTEPDSRYRTVVLPLLFMGRDRHGEEYFAVFPLGGKIHEFLGRDTITFVLFPLYAHSTVNDLDTHSVLWPIVSRTRGEGVERFRVFPLYGRSDREGQWKKRFFLWPFWTSATYERPGSSGRAFVLFPVFGRVDLEDQQSWMVLPPFFRWARSEERKTLLCPWPFFQSASGDVDKLYLWPLWGKKTWHAEGATGKSRKSSFFLWPIFSTQETERTDHVLKRFYALPIVYYESRTRKTEDEGQRTEDGGRKTEDGGQRAEDQGRGVDEGEREVMARYLKVWPLASYRREEQTTRLRLLALWPLKHTPNIERNFAPFWTLYSRTRIGDVAEDEVLWGLYRHRRDGEGRRRLSLFPLFSFEKVPGDAESRDLSLLLGLIKYRREGWRKRWRLLYFLNLGGDPEDREE